METNIKQKAEVYAGNCHRTTNHLYDGKPYTEHLKMVVRAANRFIHLIPKDQQDNVMAGCWVHDVIEDTRQTYNDVKKELNETIAELAYALTNEKGKTRKERSNDKYYEGIKNTPFAIFIKVCDRIANIEYAKMSGSSMFEIYQKENENFVEKLYDKKYDELFNYLNKCVDNSQ